VKEKEPKISVALLIWLAADYIKQNRSRMLPWDEYFEQRKN